MSARTPRPRVRLANKSEKGAGEEVNIVMFSALAAFLVLVVFLRGLYLTVSSYLWRDAGEDRRRPSVRYRKDSRLCPDIVRACTTLTHKFFLGVIHNLSWQHEAGVNYPYIMMM
ncbi:hypothetical protein GBAR_LOCUS24853 [Geodia barretti]|uniref:Uncharacterized protein n=1 Tax=Geodia barretti TaxID=519541 RepID=A0AA35TAQ7_GEOBA|nr:hypothetical protein GBAR_LOCUS24853 [Geodia barretti]